MADFEAIIRQHVGEDGNIPTSAINAIVTAINKAVGNEFVAKERYKAKLSEIDNLKEQVQTAEDNATTAEKWKEKHDTLKAEFDKFKGEVTAKETKAEKKNAYQEILKAANLPEKWFDRVMRGVDFDSLELDEKGAIKNAKDITKTITEEWADVIGTTGKSGADTGNPPGGNPSNGNPANTRAAQLAKQYVASRYGEIKTE